MQVIKNEKKVCWQAKDLIIFLINSYYLYLLMQKDRGNKKTPLENATHGKKFK